MGKPVPKFRRLAPPKGAPRGKPSCLAENGLTSTHSPSPIWTVGSPSDALYVQEAVLAPLELTMI